MREPSQVAGQLLERDPAAATTGAAATNSRLPRCASAASVPDRARIDHRLSDEREERPVLVLEVAAQRADVDGLPARPGRIGGTAAMSVGQLCARAGVLNSRRDGAGDADEEQASRTADGDDRRAARVADRLAVDAARARRAGDAQRTGRMAPARRRRWPSSRSCQAAASAGPAAVLGQERLLERRLAADEVERARTWPPRGRPA